MSSVTRLALTILLAVSLTGCKSAPAEPDAALPPPEDDLAVAPLPDVRPAPDKPDPSVMVAAVQYASGQFAEVAGCGDDLCALSALVKDAKQQGAEMAGVPEGSADQTTAELAPAIGDAPATDARWKEGSIIKTFAKLALEQKMFLVFNVVTQEGSTLYNTNLAVGPDGKVLARHYKIQLFTGEEKYFKPGTTIENSFFESPVGRTGLLICADAQCVVTDMKVTGDCSAASVALLKDFFSAEKKPDTLFFSAHWTVGGAGIWAALNVQKKTATYGPSYLVAANHSDPRNPGRGGGIYDPSGNALAQDASGKPVVLVARIPRVKK